MVTASRLKPTSRMTRLRSSFRLSSMNGTSSTTRPARVSGSSHGASAAGRCTSPEFGPGWTTTGVGFGCLLSGGLVFSTSRSTSPAARVTVSFTRLEPAAPAEQAQIGDLFLDVVLVARELAAQTHDLRDEHHPDSAQHSEREHHHEHDRRNARKATALEQGHQPAPAGTSAGWPGRPGPGPRAPSTGNRPGARARPAWRGERGRASGNRYGRG